MAEDAFDVPDDYGPGTPSLKAILLREGIVFEPGAVVKVDENGKAIAERLPYDLPFSFLGKPGVDAVLARIVAPRAFTIPEALAGSAVNVGVNPTAEAVLTLKKGGVEFGTATIAVAGGVTLAAAAAAEFAAGDVLTIHAPAVQDATLADVSVTLAGVL